MENNDNPGKIKQTAQDVKDYAELYADRVRLGLIENFSVLFNSLFGVFLMIIFAGIAAVFFAVALTWVIGWMIGTMLGAIVLMGCLFLCSVIIVYLNRKRLIVNQMVRVFSKMVHDMNQKRTNHE